MSLNAYVCKDNLCVYVHNGNRDMLYNTLREHYNTEKLVDELIKLGDLSSVGSKLAPEPHQKHSFDNPIDDVTIAYHRDRGQKLNIRSVLDSEIHGISKNAIDVFKFMNGVWYVYDSVNREFSADVTVLLGNL